jgi:DNA-binding transcriptional MocR family regulator
MNWLPAIADRPGPKYLRIADALAEDIYSGRLAAGDRLPTHRELAWRLSVTVGTVSRSYAEAERRGLIVGEVGRGSFVRPGARSSQTIDMPGVAAPKAIELGVNRPPAHLNRAEFSAALLRLSKDDRLPELMNYQAHTGAWDHRDAGASWISQRGLSYTASNVLVTSGAEHAIASAIMGLTDPGDTILVENLTWSGVRALGSLHRLQLKPVAMDEQGLNPDALEAACRTSGARVLYCMPTIHNPTTTFMPSDRRRAIADIARRWGVTIVEDDVYGFLPEDAPPALSAYAPECCIYITAASKCIAPGLRVGFAAVPNDRIGRFSAASRALNWMAPPAMADIVSGWIRDGTADQLALRIRSDVRRRQVVAARVLEGLTFRTHPAAFHLWLDLPEPWRGGDVVRTAAQRGLSMTATEMFVPGRGEPPHALRVTISATEDEAELETGLATLRDILESRPEPCLAVA